MTISSDRTNPGSEPNHTITTESEDYPFPIDLEPTSPRIDHADPPPVCGCVVQANSKRKGLHKGIEVKPSRRISKGWWSECVLGWCKTRASGNFVLHSTFAKALSMYSRYGFLYNGLLTLCNRGPYICSIKLAKDSWLTGIVG